MGKYWFANNPSGRLLAGSKTHDWGDVAAAAEESTTVTVTGAALGDIALTSTSLNISGAGTPLVSAHVSAADTVTVTIANTHASAGLSIAEATLRVLVIPSGAVDDIIAGM